MKVQNNIVGSNFSINIPQLKTNVQGLSTTTLTTNINSMV